jgi:hypothetical protein
VAIASVAALTHAFPLGRLSPETAQFFRSISSVSEPCSNDTATGVGINSQFVESKLESEGGGLVAQRLEQRTHNPLVVGSNPTGPTIGLR